MKKILILIVVLVILGAGDWFLNQKAEAPSDSLQATTTSVATDSVPLVVEGGFPYQIKVETLPENQYAISVKISLLDSGGRVKQIIRVGGIEAILGNNGKYTPEVIDTGSKEFPFMLLIQDGLGATGNRSYVYRLYDSKTGFLTCGGVRMDNLTGLESDARHRDCFAANIGWDKNKQILVSYTNNGCVGQCWIKEEYQIKDGRLLVVSRISQNFPEGNFNYPMIRIYEKLINGQLVEQSRKQIYENEVWSD